RRELQEVAEATADAGIGVESIERAVFGYRSVDGGGDVFLGRNIRRHGQCRTASLPDRGGGILDLFGAVDGHDLGAFLREQNRAGATDTAGGTRYQGDAPVETFHILLPKFPVSQLALWALWVKRSPSVVRGRVQIRCSR